MYKNWTDLIYPQGIDIDRETLTDKFGKFQVSPLERGFGTTIGNSLRRILLSSLQGAAITAVKIEGVKHEFSTLKGVSEDVSDILLNLKEVIFLSESERPEKIEIHVNKPGVVTAADIQTNDRITVLNPEQHICTLNEKGSFDAVMTIKMGKGYKISEENKEEGHPVDTIFMDSIFTPIEKVNFNVSQARVGQRTDYDKLTLEVWTNGSVKPQDAVAYSAKILKEQLQIFINFDEEKAIPKSVEYEMDETKPRVNENLLRRVDELELSVRSTNCLENADIKFIGELVQRSEGEMLRTKNFGRKSLNEIKEILTEMGFSLGMKLDQEVIEEINKIRQNAGSVVSKKNVEIEKTL
ncbi:MAG: DNA-directed RNA polymerase subunit alpha [Bdellovibrionales bacterium]|nr:DNA-directed RNA polymerase subunit alpha [Bdellovibrionales bacterium]